MARRSRSRSPPSARSRASRRDRDRERDRERAKDRERERGPRRSRSRSRSRSRGRRQGDGRRRSSSDAGARGEAKEAAGETKGEDKAGEISMSVEETNKLRAQLGLKPLSVGPKKEAEVNLQKSSAQVAQERERAAIEQALAQSRKKRELSHKLAGQSLGEMLRQETAADALSWVKQSRAKPKAATSGGSGEDKAEVYDAAALAGMTVGHAVDSFEEGQEVVLTLKDTSVLAADGNDVNDDDDELVNVEMSERDRRDAQHSRAERALMPVYTGYDDDEFIQVGKPRSKKRTGKKLLAQYDEDDDARAAEDARKFTLDAQGATSVSKVRGTGDENAADLDDDGVAVISLAMDRSKAVDEYFTAEEMEAQFKKKGKKLRKKKKKSRHHEEPEVAEQDAGRNGAGGNAEEDSSSLIAQLESEAKKNAAGSRDRGRRKRRHADSDDEDKVVAEDEEGLRRFQEAREKANTVASDALAASNLTVKGGDVVAIKPKRKRKAVVIDEDAAMVDEVMDIELNASLARARRLAQLQEAKQKQEEAAEQVAESNAPTSAPISVGPASEGRIAMLVKTVAAGSKPTAAAVLPTSEPTALEIANPVGNVFGQAPGQMSESTKTVVFNDATDFETRLRNAMEKRTAQFQAATLGNGVPSATSAASGTNASVTNGTSHDQDEEMKEEGSDSEQKENDEGEDGDKDAWGEVQPLVSSGLGATLALLRKTGDLRQTRVERQAGRANDSRDRNVEDELRVKDGVKLDYRDEFGRLLTKKEAFRVLSYKFHGHGPGKKKQDKRLRQLKQELEAQKLLSGEGSTKMMEVLEKKQKAGKQAHVVLSSGT